MTKVKCAICGGDYNIISEVSGSYFKDVENLYRCKCQKCGLLTPYRNDKLQAIRAWEEANKKIANGEYPEVVEQLKKEINNGK